MRYMHQQLTRLSLFEKVILANTIMVIVEALAGLWITSHNVEAHHYLIDTSFIVLATLLSLSINIALLNASFRPLFGLLRTIRAVSAGQTQARAKVFPLDSEIGEMARAFNDMLDRLEQARREQAMLILQAQEEERHRLARELHDESSQSLTALLVHIEILQQTIQMLPESASPVGMHERLRAGLDSLTQIGQQTLEDIRTLSQQLRPRVLDDLGLPAALRWLAEDYCQRFQLVVDLSIEGFDASSPVKHNLAPYETAVFRIAQESLTNVARHAHAHKAIVRLRREQSALHLRIQDDGNGYDPTQSQKGSGIFYMRERAELLGGSFTVHSRPGQGTSIEVTLPLESELYA